MYWNDNFDTAAPSTQRYTPVFQLSVWLDFGTEVKCSRRYAALLLFWRNFIALTHRKKEKNRALEHWRHWLKLTACFVILQLARQTKSNDIVLQCQNWIMRNANFHLSQTQNPYLQIWTINNNFSCLPQVSSISKHNPKSIQCPSVFGW